MGSIRKISLLAAAVAAAIAVAAPAAASAAKLEYANGEQVPAGAKFSLKQNQLKIMGPGAYMPCSGFTLPAEVTENNAVSAAGIGLGVANGFCQWTPQEKAAKVELTSLQFNGKSTGTISLKVSVQWTSGWCEAEGTVPMYYTPGTSRITVTGKFEKWVGCGSSIGGQFDLFATNPNPGQSIVIN